MSSAREEVAVQLLLLLPGSASIARVLQAVAKKRPGLLRDVVEAMGYHLQQPVEAVQSCD